MAIVDGFTDIKPLECVLESLAYIPFSSYVATIMHAGASGDRNVEHTQCEFCRITTAPLQKLTNCIEGASARRLCRFTPMFRNPQATALSDVSDIRRESWNTPLNPIDGMAMMTNTYPIPVIRVAGVGPRPLEASPLSTIPNSKLRLADILGLPLANRYRSSSRCLVMGCGSDGCGECWRRRIKR